MLSSVLVKRQANEKRGKIGRLWLVELIPVAGTFSNRLKENVHNVKATYIHKEIKSRTSNGRCIISDQLFM